jgi:hypothetical protein
VIVYLGKLRPYQSFGIHQADLLARLRKFTSIIHSFEGLLGQLDELLAPKSPSEANFRFVCDSGVSSPSHLSDKPTFRPGGSRSIVRE